MNLTDVHNLSRITLYEAYILRCFMRNYFKTSVSRT